MKHIGYINTEGGPLILIDAFLAPKWKGIEEDGTDYKRACSLFDSNQILEGGIIPIEDSHALLWEMEGAGTADVFKKDENHFFIVRTWPVNPQDESFAESLAEMTPENLIEIGELLVPSNNLVILWATESGKCVESVEISKSGLSNDSRGIGDSGFIFPLRSHHVRCFHDKVETNRGLGRRLHIIAQ